MFQNLNEIVFSVTKLNVLVAFLCFFVLVSLLAIILVFTDKKLAIKGGRRIPEKTLFIVAVLGGAIAEFFMMMQVRHKTFHKRFMLGLPLIFMVQIAIFVWWVMTWF